MSAWSPGKMTAVCGDWGWRKPGVDTRFCQQASVTRGDGR